MPRLSKDKIAELFPWETFPIRMEWKEKGITRVAWFQCHEHMQKQYDRVKKPRLKVDVRYKDPSLKPPEKPKRKPRKKKVQFLNWYRSLDPGTDSGYIGPMLRGFPT